MISSDNPVPSSDSTSQSVEINHPSSSQPTESTEPTEPVEITHSSPTEPTETILPSPTEPTEPPSPTEPDIHPSTISHSSLHNNNTYLLVMCISTDSHVLFLFFYHSRH